MFLRTFILALSVGTAYGCSCSEPSPQFKIEHSELIFRGRITALRDTTKVPSLEARSLARDTGKMVVFRVSRIWKGDLGQTFEMPALEETSVCWGFWPDFLKVGNDLLVYASHAVPGGAEYITAICGFHKLAENAKDLKILGPGRPPTSPR
jgi:hypothetical protein